MIRSTDEIILAIPFSTKNKRAFLKECLLIIEDKDEAYIVSEIKRLAKDIRLMLKKRKDYATTYSKKEAAWIFKKELRTSRRQLKGLKYLIITQCACGERRQCIKSKCPMLT